MSIQAIFRQRGGTIDYTPASDLPVGSVVKVGGLLGVNQSFIEGGRLGALAVAEGVYECLKDNVAFAQGEAAYAAFDAAGKFLVVTNAENATSATSSVPFGYAAAPSAAGDERGRFYFAGVRAPAAL